MATESSRFFFSYSRDDSAFVLKLAQELRNAGANLWLDRLDIRGGQRWDDAIQAALQSCQGMLAVLSPSSVASQNVLDEVSYGLEEHKQVIPVLYQKCAIPFRLRRVQYVDFSSSYEEGFAELLRTLGLEAPAEKITLPQTEPRVEPQIERREPEEEVAPPAIQVEERRDEPAATKHGRRNGSLVGAVLGVILGAISPSLASSSIEGGGWVVALLLGTLGAFTGFIVGTNRRIITITGVTCLVGTALFALLSEGSDKLFFLMALGTPFSAIIGAVAGLVLESFKNRRR